MAIMDALTVLGILGTFAWLILMRLNKKNPEAIGKTIEWFKGKTEKKPSFSEEDQRRQIYEEKRSIM